MKNKCLCVALLLLVVANLWGEEDLIAFTATGDFEIFTITETRVWPAPHNEAGFTSIETEDIASSKNFCGNRVVIPRNTEWGVKITRMLSEDDLAETLKVMKYEPDGLHIRWISSSFHPEPVGGYPSELPVDLIFESISLEKLKYLVIKAVDDLPIELFDRIGLLKNLEVLSIRGTGVKGDITPDLFEGLKSLKKLKVIGLHGDFLIDEAIEAISGLKGIRELRLAGVTNNLSQGMIDAIGRINSLEYLYLLPKSCPSLLPLAKLTSLQSLCIASTSPIAAGELSKILSSNPQIRELRLSLAEDDHIQLLADIKNLEMLALFWPKLSEKGISCLASLAGIRYLLLDGFTLDDTGMSALSQLRELRWLYLSVPELKVSRKCATLLAKCSKLEWFSFRFIGDEKIAKEIFASLSSLRYLSLHDPITDDWLVSLPAFPKLRELRLGGGNISDASIEWISSLPELESFYMYEASNLTNKGFDKLCRDTNLKCLSLYGCISLINRYIESLRALKRLESLTLWSTHMKFIAFKKTERLPPVPYVNIYSLSEDNVINKLSSYGFAHHRTVVKEMNRWKESLSEYRDDALPKDGFIPEGCFEYAYGYHLRYFSERDDGGTSTGKYIILAIPFGVVVPGASYFDETNRYFCRVTGELDELKQLHSVTSEDIDFSTEGTRLPRFLENEW